MWSYARRGAGARSLEGAGSGAGSSTQPCDWSGVLYTVGLVDAPRLMPIRPRLTRPPRILIASDQNHALSDVVRSLGRRGYSVLRVFAEASVLERARSARPDVIVLDATLGEGQALDLSRTLRVDPSIGSSTPILLLVPSRPGHQDHLTALRAGVWELVRQPLDVAELLGKLDRYVLVKVERDGVSRRDLVDEVTGLYSTHGLARRAGELILQAAHHNTSVACVAVAPDRHGPDAGTDGLDSLRGVARLLEASGRRSDAIGRIGPAEFAVVAAGVNRAGARQLANRLRDSVGFGIAERRVLQREERTDQHRLLAPGGHARRLILRRADGHGVRHGRRRPLVVHHRQGDRVAAGCRVHVRGILVRGRPAVAERPAVGDDRAVRVAARAGEAAHEQRAARGEIGRRRLVRCGAADG